MRRRALAKLMALGLACAPLGARSASGASAWPQEETAQRAFSIPERTEALRRAREVEAHLAARRWPQAIQTLQDLIERDGDAVLPSSYRAKPKARSVHSVYPGAGQWAQRKLRALPGDAMKVYRQRFGVAANLALEIAIESQDPKLLVAVEARWPLCDAAPRALWILGELELEAGHAQLALLAWDRASQSLQRVQPTLDGQPNPRVAALNARSEHLRERLLKERNAARLPNSQAKNSRERHDPLATGDLSQARFPLPSKDADGWYTFLNMWPFAVPGSSKVLYPTEHDGRVLVSNSIQLFCLDAFTGREFWRSEAPHGWELLADRKQNDLLKGLYREMLQVQPVVAGRVALVALQVPYTSLPNLYYRDITVMSAIPQRRLYAFDLETGAPLWNHAPKLELNPSKNELSPISLDSYAQGMMIAATPVIVGSRVLVPCYILEGRIDYQVACYELETGRLLWKTNLISGQRSRNMFGRAMREFCSSPLVVEGERVIAQTDLGAIAALDLNTGSILWESLYRQIPQPKSRGFSPRTRNLTWLTSKPVVIDGCVISTPSDSDEIYAYDLEDGRALWSYSESALSRGSRSHFDRLLGADQNTIYLGGSRVAALQKPGGLRSRSAFEELWHKLVPGTRTTPPQLLCKDGILVPLTDRWMVYSRREGNKLSNLGGEWDAAGTPALSDGILLTLGRDGLRGYFDWPTLLDKQKREYRKNPGNYEIALASAELFTRRAEAGLRENEFFIALDYIKQARLILENIDSEGGFDRRTGNLLHQVLRSEAAALERKGDSTRALASLGRARELAPHARALRDTLLQEEHLLRGSRIRGAHLAILDTLEQLCSAQPLPNSYLAQGNQTLELDLEYKGRAPSIGLWVLFQRAAENSLAGKMGACFEDWGQVLVRYDDFMLQGQSASQLASRRMGLELQRPGARKAFQPFEERAQGLLSNAVKSKDLSALDRLTKAYPHSRAAESSDQLQIDWAYEQGDLERLASIVHGPRAEEVARGKKNAILRLGRLLGEAGNRAYERGLLHKLLRDNPSASSDLPTEAGHSLQAKLDDLLAQVPAQPERMPHFKGDIIQRRVQSGRHSYLGRMNGPRRAAGTSPELHLYAKQPEVKRDEPRGGLSKPRELGIEKPIHLVSYSEAKPERTNWHIIVQDEFVSQDKHAEACVTSNDRVVIGGRLAIHAYDAEGQLVWEQPKRSKQVLAKFQTLALLQRDGVLVAWMQEREDDKNLIVRAFDLRLGTPLWETQLERRSRRWFTPIMGPGQVVFLSKPYMLPVVAKVIDLFSGASVGDYELGKISGPVERISWIEGEHLMIPHFSLTSKEKEHIAVHDLFSGRELWSQALPGGEELRNIVRYDGRTFAVMFTSQPGHSGGVYEFKPKARSLRRILPLRVGERPLGVNDRELLQLTSPELFLYTNDPTLGLRLRTLDLAKARSTWTRPLPLAANQTFQPLVSDTHVGILANSRVGRRKVASLFLLNRRTGAQELRLELDKNLSKANLLRLVGLGDSIYISGSGTLSSGHLLEIIQTSEESK